MTRGPFRHRPVSGDSGLAGIIDITDICRALTGPGLSRRPTAGAAAGPEEFCQPPACSSERDITSLGMAFILAENGSSRPGQMPANARQHAAGRTEPQYLQRQGGNHQCRRPMLDVASPASKAAGRRSRSTLRYDAGSG